MKITKLNFINIFIIFTGLIVIVDMWMIFVWVPTEINQGAIQRILYLHVPLAWGSMAAICIVAFSSVMYLYKKSEKWDRIALSAAEAGAIFGAMMLISGMLWARPVWGVFWTGEAKLTFSLILFILFVAYLMFRVYFPKGIQQKRISAVLGIIGAIDTPIIYFAANLWERAHPPLIVGPAATNDSSISQSIGLTLLFFAITFTLVLASLILLRYALRKHEDEIDLIIINKT